MIDKEWFIERFDSFVSEAADNGAEVEKSRDAIAHAYSDAVESGEAERWHDDLTTEGRSLFDRFVKPAREQRKSSMRKSVQYLVDALNGETVLGALDPRLDQAYPLGDGRDKTLRYWTQDDWQSATTERYRNAAAVTAAANEFDEAADRIRRALVARGVNTTGELFAA